MKEHRTRKNLAIAVGVILTVALLLAFTPPGKRVLASLGLTAACSSDNACENRPK